ncbi:MAG: ABC transporter ATP-binding protein [Candidatus Auribacterota bacterium]|nr:ABC transporter ATP-binding protein [Candidatus Auribacterota bacterium]
MDKNSQNDREIILRVENLTKIFPGVVANDKVSLEIRKGEIHCLLGENGAGKSTIAECLYGTYRPDGGRIIYKEKEVHLSSPRDAINLGIGMVHQHFEMIPPMTVMENIVVGTESKGMGLKLGPSTEKVAGICENYGIELDLNTVVSQLPVGKQQWVEILKALYVGAEFLILDEPTAVLTPQEIDKFFTILKKMTLDGLSIILITHKLNEVMEISDRVTVMRKGKKIGTVNTSDTDKADLARRMVGREVVFRVTREEIEPGKVVLDLKDIYALKKTGVMGLNGVSLSVRRHQILGLAGVSGNGQREIFDVAIGVRKATRGQIFLDGENITNLSPRDIMNKGIASIPQDRIVEGLCMDFSIYDNIILGNQRDAAFSSGLFLSTGRIDSFTDQQIKDYDIMCANPAQTARCLSGGNLQKLILAREMSQNPKCLIAGQPTRGLDVGAIEYVHHQLLKMREAGAGILLISEELDEIFGLSDYIAVIYKGEIMGIFKNGDVTVEEVGLLMAGIRQDAA